MSLLNFFLFLKADGCLVHSMRAYINFPCWQLHLFLPSVDSKVSEEEKSSVILTLTQVFYADT